MEFGPEGKVSGPLRQLKIRFNRPVVPLGGQAKRDAGDVIRISPLVPGHSVWRGTDLLVFEPAGELPLATRFQVSLDPTLAAYDGARLRRPLRWEMESERPHCQASTYWDDDLKYLGPSEPILWHCNMAISSEGLQAVVATRVDGKSWPFRVAAWADEAARLSTWVEHSGRPGYFREAPAEWRERGFVVWPAEPWPSGSDIQVCVGRGLRTPQGQLPSDVSTCFAARGSPEPRPITARCPNALEVLWSTPLREGESARVHVEPNSHPRLWTAWWTRDAKSNPARWVASYVPTHPGMTYEISVPAGLVDVYGRRTSAPWNRHVACELPEPKARLELHKPQGRLEASKPWVIGIEGDQLPSVQVQLAAFDAATIAAQPQLLSKATAWLEEQLYFHQRDPKQEALKLRLADLGGHRSQIEIGLRDLPNQWVGYPLDLAQLAGQRPALVAVSVQGRGVEEQRGLYEVSDLGLLALIGEGSSAIQAIRLSTGETWPGVELHAVTESEPAVSLGSTDRRGLLTFHEWPGDEAVKEHLLFMGRQGQELGLLPVGSLYRRERPQRGQGAGEEILGAIMTERRLFLPGETVYFVGWAAIATPDNREGLRPLPPGTAAEVSLERDGVVLATRHVPLSKAGKLWGQLALPQDVRLGHYTVLAKIPWVDAGKEAPVTLTSEIRVAAFRAAEIGLELHLDSHEIGPGQTPRLTVTATHLYGGLAQLNGAEVERECAPYVPHNPEGHWHLGPDLDARPALDRARFSVAHEELQQGRFSLSLPTLPPHPFLPAHCTLRASVQDRALRSTAAETELTIHPTDFYLGLRWDQPADRQDLRVWVQGLDKKLRPAPARDILLTLRDPDGESILRSLRLSAGQRKPASATLAHLPAGEYLLSVEARDRGRPLLSSRKVYIHEAYSSEPQVLGGKEDLSEERLKIRAPDTGQVGRALAIHLEAPAEARSGAVAILRHGLREVRTVQFRQGKADLHLWVSGAWIPEVEVQATAVLPSRQHPVELLRGTATVQIDSSPRELRVKLSGPEQAIPGQEVAYDVRVSSSDGQPVAGAHVTAWAVDEGVLRLAPAGLPDLVQVFAPTDSSVAIADNFAQVLAPFDPTPKSTIHTAHAPDVIPGQANVRGAAPEPSLRKSFQITPFFVGEMQADQSGKARLRFRLPDNLTRYRITALGSAELGQTGVEGRFGTGQTTVEASLPALVRPMLPRFLRVGDRSDAVVVAHNRTQQPLALEVGIAVEPVGPQAAVGVVGERQRTLTLAPGQELRVAFALEAKRAGQAKVRWTSRVKSRGSAARGDAVELPLPVLSESVPTDRLAMGGYVPHNSQRCVPTQLPEAAAQSRDQGALAIRLATSPIEDLRGVVTALASYRFDCAEQTASRLLPFLLFPSLASEDANTARANALATALARFQALAAGQGRFRDGLAFWPKAPQADLFATAWALLVLDHAEAALLAPGLRRDLALGLHDLLQASRDNEPPPWQGLLSLARLALNQSGEVPRDFADIAPGPEPSHLATALAALALTAADPAASPGVRTQRAEQARRWLSDALARIPEHDQVMHVARAADGTGFFAAPAESEAALAWALARAWPEHPALAKLLRAVAEHRRGGAWGNTLENAFVLLAAHELGPTTRVDANAEILTDGKVLLPRHSLTGTDSVLVQSFPLLALPESFFAPPTQPAGLLQLSAGPGGDIYYGLEVSYPTEHPDSASDDGLTVQRRIRLPQQADGHLVSAEAGGLLALDVILKTQLALEQVAVEVPLPAGLEAVDPSLPIEALGIPGTAVRHRELFVSHSELRPEKVLLFLDRLHPGESRLTLFARAQAPGHFALPGPQAEAMYNPEIRGRGAGTHFTVRAPGED